MLGWLLAAVALLFVAYAVRGIVVVRRWARRVQFSVRGDGPEALAVVLFLWLVWPALRDVGSEQP